MSEFFSRFEQTAWRLETRPFYVPDAAEIGRWLAGQPPTAEQRDQRQQWVDDIAAATAAGRQIGRVLVVTFPLSPYWQWRIATAAAHVAVGEHIHVADRTRWRGLHDLGADFWLFDDEWVRLLDYTPDGMFVGTRDLLLPALVDGYRADLNQARAYAVPLPRTVPAAG